MIVKDDVIFAKYGKKLVYLVKVEYCYAVYSRQMYRVPEMDYENVYSTCLQGKDLLRLGSTRTVIEADASFLYRRID